MHLIKTKNILNIQEKIGIFNIYNLQLVVAIRKYIHKLKNYT